MLALAEVCKAYSGKPAVVDLDLELRGGEVYGLLGPNGAGKTTTLKMIAGLVIPDSGSILLDGEPIHDCRSRIAYVPDEPTIYSKLTGREFLRFSGRLRKLPSRVIDERIAYHTDLFGMGDWLDMRAESYSHGMIQRVVLSSAFLAKPDLYIVDEPIVGLDPATAETFHMMAAAAASSGATVLISTHTLSVAQKFCDRLGIISEGRLIAEIGEDQLEGRELQELFFEITGTGPVTMSSYFDESPADQEFA
jgi:ABC-2 type transport system ATP-binding protein